MKDFEKSVLQNIDFGKNKVSFSRQSKDDDAAHQFFFSIFFIACNEAGGDTNTQSPTTSQVADLADDDQLQPIISPLNENQLKSIKAVYLSLTCDMPTLRLCGMYVNTPKSFVSI